MDTQHATSTDRREFLQAAGLGAAAALTASLPATARAASGQRDNPRGPDRRRRPLPALVGGAARRCRASKSSPCATCGTKTSRPGARPSAATRFTTKDHRALLDRKDVDAVLIATPDHWHVPITIDACAAGKDVYVEKPLTHDLAEGAAVIDAQNKHRRIVQVGMQQRSMPQFQKAFEIIRSGQLGKIHKVHLTWNRNQPRHNPKPEDIDPASGRLAAVPGQCSGAAVRCRIAFAIGAGSGILAAAFSPT